MLFENAKFDPVYIVMVNWLLSSVGELAFIVF